MKLKRTSLYKNKVLKLQLVKTKIFDKKQYLNNIKLEDIEYRLKKALHLIYKFHIKNKKIAFIGTPVILTPNFRSLFKTTNHAIIPESIWMNGILTNQSSSFRYLSKDQKTAKLLEILFQLKRKSDLIVICDSSINAVALEEGYVAKIPIISFGNNFSITNNKSSYKIPGNFNSKVQIFRNNFLFSILLATLKKADKTKQNKR